jgi:ADP-heptose:LPS heptosyltransferase
MRKVIVRNSQSPGDIVMLTAAVRDLHRAHPGMFATEMKTTANELWEHNPNMTRFAANEQEVEDVSCGYPLIHRSNTGPWHFIHGFTQHLGEQLGVQIDPTDFKGDIYLSDEEKHWMSQVQEITGTPVPFWIVAAGGKYDFTAKWWHNSRYQEVVDHFSDRILFVQIGESGHHHPALRNVIDLRGKTNIRQLVRLMYHAQGVLCPVTFLMHLAAAVPVREGMPKNRPCVVVAGGREPMQWEAYPHHQYLHTNGALPCCDQGGCWKSRVVPLGDGDEKDQPTNLCTHVIHVQNANLSYILKPDNPPPAHAQPTAAGRVASHFLPRCLDMITASDVIRAVERYFSGGVVKYLDAPQAKTAQKAIDQHEKATDHHRIS